ncbi:MAG: carboxylating nicotinate-nucleotide diphosphorylase [Candidatus Omnitrophota bacterium]
MVLNKRGISETVRHVLDEDIGGGDITSQAIIPKRVKVQAKIFAREPGVLAGIAVSMAAFQLLDSKIKFMPLVLDGRTFKANEVIAYTEGDARAILSAERVALNFLSRLSGIATLTAKFVTAIRPYRTKIMDTRKTTPGLRILEKYAVGIGGGYNHRMGLYDQILIKDNHLKVVSYKWPIVHSAVARAKRKRIKTEIEVTNLREFKSAIKTKPDIIMLDNMSVREIKEAVKLRNSLRTTNRALKTQLEASGGVDLKNVKKIASAGVDMISIGALTHSARPIDFSLEIVK